MKLVFLFQTLDLAVTATRVVSIVSNPYSGMIVVGTQDGTVYTFTPVEISSFDRNVESKDDPVAIFGRYRWVNGVTLPTQEVFYQSGEVPNFGDRRSSLPGELVDISTSFAISFILCINRWNLIQSSTCLQRVNISNLTIISTTYGSLPVDL